MRRLRSRPERSYAFVRVGADPGIPRVARIAGAIMPVRVVWAIYGVYAMYESDPIDTAPLNDFDLLLTLTANTAVAAIAGCKSVRLGRYAMGSGWTTTAHTGWRTPIGP